MLSCTWGGFEPVFPCPRSISGCPSTSFIGFPPLGLIAAGSLKLKAAKQAKASAPAPAAKSPAAERLPRPVEMPPLAFGDLQGLAASRALSGLRAEAYVDELQSSLPFGANLGGAPPAKLPSFGAEGVTKVHRAQETQHVSTGTSGGPGMPLEMACFDPVSLHQAMLSTCFTGSMLDLPSSKVLSKEYSSRLLSWVQKASHGLPRCLRTRRLQAGWDES